METSEKKLTLGGAQTLYNDLRRRAASADENLAPYYDATKTYAVNDMVMYQDDLYKCTTAIETAEAWTAAHWTNLSMADEVGELSSALTKPYTAVSNISNMVLNDGMIYNPPMIVGTYSNTFEITESTTYCRTGLIPVNSTQPLYVRISTNASGCKWMAFVISESGELLNRLGNYSSNKTITTAQMAGCAFVAFRMTTTNGTDTVDSSTFADFSIEQITRLTELSRLPRFDRADAILSRDRLSNHTTHITVNEFETGRYDSTTGLPRLVDNYVRSKYPIAVDPSYPIYVYRDDSATETVTVYQYDSGRNIATTQTLDDTDYGTAIMLDSSAAYIAFNFYATGITTSTVNALTVVQNGDHSLYPAYNDSMLATKEATIVSNMNTAGRDGDTFVWITDLHWESNYRHSPGLIDHILHHTKVQNVFCGGDLFNEGEKADMYKIAIDCIRALQFDLADNFLPITRGNHDDNSNWSDDADVTAYSFDTNELYSTIFSQLANKVTWIYDGDFSFYFDNAEAKTRYIFVDSRRDGLTIPYNPLKNLLNDTPDGYYVVFFMHIIYASDAFKRGATGLMTMINAYKNKTTGSYLGAEFDFTNAHGTPVCLIGGHIHLDQSWTYDDANNISGVPVIITDTDSYRDHSGTDNMGTTSEQCFDVITLDYTNRLVKCVRIGRGSDRTFSF